MKRLIIYYLLFFFNISHVVKAQTLVASFQIQKNSTLTISGESNVFPFRLVQGGESLSKNNISIEASIAQNKIQISKNQIDIAVKDFKADYGIGIHDFFKLMKVDTYPTFQIQTENLDIFPISTKAPSNSGTVAVNITITGVTKHYTIPISLNNNGILYNVKGVKKICICDFGLTPPVKMLGLVKLSSWITIDFNLVCKIITNEKD